MQETHRAHASLPTGAVTFLFTDIEGSTRLWETEPARMANALARHDELCRAVVAVHGGRLVKMTGDGLHAAFDDAAAAVATALELQQGMTPIAADCGIPLRMRCGLHAGASQARDGDYFGTAVNRAARIMSAAHGGQILVSQAVVDLGGGRFRNDIDLLHLGRVRLRDLSGPEDVWQLMHGDLQPAFPALRSLDAIPNNLPQQLTSFIGREREIAEIKGLLASTRLLTLTGSGGCGKTRLSLQVAADGLELSADGVWLAELAALADSGLVPQAVASVLGLREEPGTPLTQTLVDHLRSRQLLLVLDNCEHLVAACGELADTLLRQCPQVILLATSREGLGIAGERTYRVPSLSMPDPQRDVTPESLSRYESARLFTERAQLQQPRFAVTEKNAPALASVCLRLDGIPLAIELAAARVRSMSVEEINQRLDQRFRLLTGGSRVALPRQQTLRALIDWSYDLLNAAEQVLYTRLAVFAGGFSVVAAEQVCSGDPLEEWEVLDVLTVLADKSLVAAEELDGQTRYRLLETVRQHARDRLREVGEEAHRQERHRDYFLALAEEAHPKLSGAEQAVWLQRLEAEHENLRSALDWSLADTESAAGLRLCGALQQFWGTRGHLSEGREWCGRVLATASRQERPKDCARVLCAAGLLAFFQGDFPAARAGLDESLAIRRRLGDRRGIADSLNNLGNVAWDQGDYSAAQALFEETLAIRRELGDRGGIAAALGNLGNVARARDDLGSSWALQEESLAIRRELGDRWGIGATLNNLGNLASRRREFASAQALFEECLVIMRELGDRSVIASTLNNLGDVVLDQGNLASARALNKESLTIRREVGDKREIANTLDGVASVNAALGSFFHAARIWGAAERLREEIGSPLPPGERPRYDQRVAVARAAVDDGAAFSQAWQEGRALTLEQAMDLALVETVPRP